MHDAADRPRPWRAALAAAGVVAAARGALAALQDGYFAAGLVGVGLDSLAADVVSGLAFSVPGAILLCLLSARLAGEGLSSVRRLGAWLLLAAPSYAFVAWWLPHEPAYVPGLSGAKGLGAHWAAAFVGWIVAYRLVLDFVAHRTGGGGRRSWKSLDVAGALAGFGAIVVSALPPRGAEAERWNVVLISVDTLRTDHVGCYGYERPTTPSIDALAEGALRFTDAYTSRSWTLAAHMSLLTALQPSVHTVDKQRSLPRGVPTLQQAFQDAGYVTAGVVDSIVWLAPRFGFDRGFHVYKPLYGGAGRKLEATYRLLDDVGERPFFLFLHYYDAHSDSGALPYEADPEDLEQFASWYDGPLEFSYDELGPGMEALLARKQPLADDERRYLASLYDAGVRTFDRHLGRLFAELSRRGLEENTVVVLTSDHGEEFYDHGHPGHGQSYRECQAIPLLVRTPDMTGPRTSSTRVELIDIGPTLAELCGVAFEPGQGLSFADVVRDGAERPGRDHILQDMGDDKLGVRTRSGNLLWKPLKYEVFDLLADPGEQDDLLAGGREGGLLDELMALVEREREAAIALRRELGIAAEGDAGESLLAGDEIEKLRALGYLDDN